MQTVHGTLTLISRADIPLHKANSPSLPRYIFELLAGVRGIENKWRSVQMWALKTDLIDTSRHASLDEKYRVYGPTILPSMPPTVPAAPVVLAPNKLEATPPSGFHYPKGRTFFLKDNNRYRARRVYSMPYEPPLDGSADVEFLQRVILPHHAYPDDDDYNHTTGKYCPKPMQGVRPFDGSSSQASTRLGGAWVFPRPSQISLPQRRSGCHSYRI
ncbi:hypothetical protein PM082_017717 [Marasmius tenuissimus]|nr:hypothetical protein PM082_017717 [Marasmius tenuissimus]